MRTLIPLALLFCFSLSTAQTYHFNQMFTCQNTNLLHPEKSHKVVYLTNAADNSYFIRLDEQKNGEYTLNFIHRDNHWVRTRISEAALTNGDLRPGCDSVHVENNPYKYQTKNYDFTSVKDTTINNTAYKYYFAAHKNPKKAKRKKIGRLLYVVDTLYPNLPLFVMETPYEEWKLERNVPNGILQEYHFFNYRDEHETAEILIKHEATNKTLFVPECPAKIKIVTTSAIRH